MSPAVHESKNLFLDAALHLIRAKGYGATTVDELCTAVHMSKGSFFHHFSGKEELAVAAAAHFAQRADEMLFQERRIQALADPVARILGFYVDFRRSMLRGDLPRVHLPARDHGAGNV